MKKVAEKPAVKAGKKTVYEAISKNVYFNGYSYRARVTQNGRMTSRSFGSKRKAIMWRNQIMRSM